MSKNLASAVVSIRQNDNCVRRQIVSCGVKLSGGSLRAVSTGEGKLRKVCLRRLIVWIGPKNAFSS